MDEQRAGQIEVKEVELVLIPGGSFWMGTGDDAGGEDDERPRHELTLASFYLATTPVTNAQYAAYLSVNPRAPKPARWDEREYNQAQQPVIGIAWEEAEAYCDWAGLALPTEAQWELACRAGTQTAYWSGDGEDALVRVGWYGDNADDRVHPVAQLPANPLGLHDMHGNVWEWCLERWGASYSEPARPGDGLREGGVAGDERVVRGGCWATSAFYVRSAARVGHAACGRAGFVGFRPARDA